MTVESIIGLVTTIMTLIFGYISKKFGIVNKKYIPIQNICIGVFSGILCYFAGLSDNLLVIILTCLISSLGAGGLYDATQTKK